MITAVEVINSRGQTLMLPFQDIGSGFVVKEIEGLDPVKATIVSSPFAQLDGEQYQNSKREKRNMVLKLGLAPNYAMATVQDLRTQLYGFLMPKSWVKFRFYVNNVQFADISGRVESFEAPPFTKDPQANITVLCFDPDFISPSALYVPGNTVTDFTEQTVDNPGTVESGFIFKLAVNRALSEFMFYNSVPGDVSYTMEFANASLVAGDLLTISTVPGSKYARLTRGGSTTSILYAISPTSSWFPLFNGENVLRVYAEGAAIPFTIEYQPRYGGL